MAGQDAVNAAKAFNEALSLSGVILTRRMARTGRCRVVGCVK